MENFLKFGRFQSRLPTLCRQTINYPNVPKHTAESTRTTRLRTRGVEEWWLYKTRSIDLDHLPLGRNGFFPFPFLGDKKWHFLMDHFASIRQLLSPLIIPTSVFETGRKNFFYSQKPVFEVFNFFKFLFSKILKIFLMAFVDLRHLHHPANNLRKIFRINIFFIILKTKKWKFFTSTLIFGTL